MFKLDLEQAEKPEIKLPASVGSSKKQENSRKISATALLTIPKPFNQSYKGCFEYQDEKFAKSFGKFIPCSLGKGHDPGFEKVLVKCQ